MDNAGSRRQGLPPYSVRTSPIWQIGRFLFSLTAMSAMTALTILARTGYSQALKGYAL
jgi:hypothetical protein